MAITLVLGNGESRLRFNWTEINYTNLIGCNAIHRDTSVDHLICCDRRMAEEACNNPKTINTLLYVRERNFHYFRKIKKNKNVRQLPDIPFHGELKRDQPDHWGSGPYALLVACNTGDKEIIILGFDLYSDDGNVNNVYKNTVNYSKAESKAVDYSYWVHQIAQVFRFNQEKKFIIVNERDWKIPKEWLLDNVSFKSFEDIILDNKYLYS